MDYEQKYNEALNDMRAIYPNLKGDAKLAVEHAFPELRESEDERMIRKIESFLSAYGADYFSNDEWREIEVWLEKQKEIQFGAPGLYYYDGEKVHYYGSPATEENLEKQDVDFSTNDTSKNDARKRRQIIALLSASKGKCMASFAKDIDECVAYLIEKQKEPVVDKEGMYYYLGGKFIYCGYPATEENPYDFAMSQQEKQKENPQSADSIPSDCVSDAKCEDRSPKHSDSDGTDIRDTPAYWKGWDDAMKQKEQKHPNGCFTCDEYKKGYESGRLNGFTAGYNKAMKEQKPQGVYVDCTEHPEWYGMPPKEQKPIDPSDDELQRHQDELYDFKVFAAKQAKEHHISFVHDFEWNNFCEELLSYFNERPKQEWSEEDEEMVTDIIASIDTNIAASDFHEMEHWLKSLRPQPKRDGGDDYNKGYIKGRADTLKEFNDMASWKPSEEQMNALNFAITYFMHETSYKNPTELRDLYEQLKKL